MKRLVKILPYFVVVAVCAGLVFVSSGKSDSVSVQNTIKNDAPLIIIDAGHGGYVLTRLFIYHFYVL